MQTRLQMHLLHNDVETLVNYDFNLSNTVNSVALPVIAVDFDNHDVEIYDTAPKKK
jgi:hypothetical protein